ncbi:MAG: cytochrome c [Sediminibacterium sp.]|nr:cytochrome c [Sediminibacterium sp.]
MNKNFLFIFLVFIIPTFLFSQTKNKGKKIYETHCLTCHQIDGGGVPHLNPPLDGSSLVNSNQLNKLIHIILYGMNDRIKIDGTMYANNMAAHNDLSNQEVADVLNYIRNEWSNKNKIIITPQQVKIIRNKTKN